MRKKRTCSSSAMLDAALSRRELAAERCDVPSKQHPAVVRCLCFRAGGRHHAAAEALRVLNLVHAPVFDLIASWFFFTSQRFETRT